MAEPPQFPDTGDDPGMELDDGPAGTPRWVKGAAIVALLLVLAFLFLVLSGRHSPGRHAAGDAPRAAVGDRQP